MFDNILGGASLALNIGGMLSARRRRKEEQERMRIEAGKQRRAGQLAEEDLFAEADATNAQQRLMMEREALAGDAGKEALRQARLQQTGPDVFAASVDPQARTKRRGAFFNAGGRGQEEFL